jgi:hypothetical protein
MNFKHCIVSSWPLLLPFSFLWTHLLGLCCFRMNIFIWSLNLNLYCCINLLNILKHHSSCPLLLPLSFLWTHLLGLCCFSNLNFLIDHLSARCTVTCPAL